MKIIFFVASLLYLNAVASFSSEEDVNGEEIINEVIIVTDQEEGEQALSELEEGDSEVVYVDENGDEYIVISEEYAEAGKATVRLKKKKSRKGRNCVAADGGASWYGPGFHGRKTANGERFNQNAMTAAHKTIKFNSLVRVTYEGRSVVVRINDAGPFTRGRVIDLSKAAAKELGLIAAGHGQVSLEIIRCGDEEQPKEEKNED